MVIVDYRSDRIALIISVRERINRDVERHSWASVGRSQGVPLAVISEGMGHHSETTTRIYLASLDTT
ncbi:MAG: site-specific integrase, partial [Muribaculaceae bacterium]|nr:site-specific integrase [Muribaculaceae bacterium]